MKIEHSYGMTHRPPGIGCVPKGSISVQSHPAFRHGSITYDRPLTTAEVVDYELTPIRLDSEIPDVAKAVAATMGDYVGEYIKPENAEILAGKLNQSEVLKVMGYVDIEKIVAELRRMTV